MNHPDTIIIRYAENQDIEACISFDEKVPRQRLSLKIQHNEVIVAVQSDHKIAGCLRFDYLWSKRPFIASIEVRPDAQRKGIGTQLLNWFIQQMQHAGHKQIYSSTMFDNQLSQNWHRKNHFIECGAMTGINRDGVGELFFSRSI